MPCTTSDPSAPAARAERLDTLWYQTVSLGVVALIAGAALALAHTATAPLIAAAQARDVATSLAQVLPDDFHDNDLLTDTIAVSAADGHPVTVYRARRRGEIVAVIYQMTGKGYGGPVRLVMGVDRNGRITGVRITGHAETPGLGDKIEAARSPWIEGFAGKSLDDPSPARWAVKKDGGVFDQFAGATITPRAVVAAVKAGLELYQAQRVAMFADPAADGTKGTTP